MPGLLWNYYGVTPWLGIPAGMLLAVLLALVIGYPCFRLKVVGHYFALVTLALSQVVLLTITAARDITGGSLGMTPKSVGFSWYALQFPDKRYFYFIALVVWLGGLAAWRWIDRGIGREALEAISEDEEAAASVGIDVLHEKMRVTVVSAALTALGGAMLGQYLMYLNPETMSGIAVSLQIVFAAIAGGMYSLLGPTVGSLLTLVAHRGPARVVRHQLHRRRQHDLRHPADPVHHLHAARDFGVVRANAPTKDGRPRRAPPGVLSP